jgi:two-component system, chemotaxis family, chemotaxis protein CheY
MKILIVEDAIFIQEILKSLVLQSGHDVTAIAGTGESAVQAALRTRPDVIFMDLVLPGLSGVEATLRIKAILPQTRIIAMSTVGMETMVARAIEVGCSDYIVKPFSAADILNAIEPNFKEVANG